LSQFKIESLTLSTMSKGEKTFEKVMSGRSDENISYDELCSILTKLGFDHRQQGTSHRIYQLGAAFANVQEGSAGKAKGYQVRQIRRHLKNLNIRP
jgi:hypothetical protein